MSKLDSDVEKLESWARSMNLTKNQYGALCAIIEVTVKNKLKEFGEHFIEMDILQFRKEQSEMIDEKKNQKGVWLN